MNNHKYLIYSELIIENELIMTPILNPIAYHHPKEVSFNPSHSRWRISWTAGKLLMFYRVCGNYRLESLINHNLQYAHKDRKQERLIPSIIRIINDDLYSILLFKFCLKDAIVGGLIQQMILPNLHRIERGYASQSTARVSFGSDTLRWSTFS